MKKSVLDSLHRGSEKQEAMIGRTLRLPTDLDKEINEFCEETKISRSVLYRRIVAEGWKAINSDAGE